MFKVHLLLFMPFNFNRLFVLTNQWQVQMASAVRASGARNSTQQACFPTQGKSTGKDRSASSFNAKLYARKNTLPKSRRSLLPSHLLSCLVQKEGYPTFSPGDGCLLPTSSPAWCSSLCSPHTGSEEPLSSVCHSSVASISTCTFERTSVYGK